MNEARGHSTSALDRSVLAALDGLDELGAVALFGSRISGRPRPESDLDVAVLPRAGFRGERRKLQSRVAVLLAELAPAGRVDVVLLDEAPELLRQRVFESCRVVILREPEAWRELRRRTMREHGDREPYRRLLRRAQRERLLKGDVQGGRP